MECVGQQIVTALDFMFLKRQIHFATAGYQRDTKQDTDLLFWEKSQNYEIKVRILTFSS